MLYLQAHMQPLNNAGPIGIIIAQIQAMEFRLYCNEMFS